MATELDADLVPEALALIEELGIIATFHVDAGSFNDASSVWTPALTDVLRKVSPPQAKESYGVAGDTTTTRTVPVIYVAASGLTFTPKLAMRVTIDGRDYTITDATATYSGELRCVWELRLE